MGIEKDISELAQAGIITADTAEKIKNYYQTKSGSQNNRMLIIFGILGSTLVGLGIILLLAHNWDSLPRFAKTVLAFIPLIAGQTACGTILFKNQQKSIWREASATFLFFAIGAAIALIGQIYNISGNFNSFMITWVALSIPAIYLMNSTGVAVLSIIGATVYGCSTGFNHHTSFSSAWYWVLMAGIIPHYILKIRNGNTGNAKNILDWFLAASITICLGTIARSFDIFMMPAYASLFGAMYLFSHSNKDSKAFSVFGTIGTTSILLTLSFEDFWNDLANETFTSAAIAGSLEFWAFILLFSLASALFHKNYNDGKIPLQTPLTYMFIAIVLLFILGIFTPYMAVLANLLVLFFGIMNIRDGAQKNHLGILNFGMFIISALIMCRFFDRDLSFIIRGLLFIAVGSGFLFTNLYLIKRRNSQTQIQSPNIDGI